MIPPGVGAEPILYPLSGIGTVLSAGVYEYDKAIRSITSIQGPSRITSAVTSVVPIIFMVGVGNGINRLPSKCCIPVTLELRGYLPVRSCFVQACLYRLLIPMHQCPRMRLTVLGLSPIEIAFFLVMLKQFPLFLCSGSHFFSQIFKMLC